MLLDRKAPDGKPSALDDGVKFAEKLGLTNADAAALRAVSAAAIVKAPTITQQPHAAALDVIATRY